jgi:hypothetical protein
VAVAIARRKLYRQVSKTDEGDVQLLSVLLQICNPYERIMKGISDTLYLAGESILACPRLCSPEHISEI